MSGKIKRFSASHVLGLTALISALALFSGALIYIILRPAEPLFFQWAHNIGIYRWIFLLRNNPFFSKIIFPGWFVYSFPNTLWAFAYTMVILQIWKNNTSTIKYFWFATIPVLVTGIEFLQFFHKIRGTFCWQDIAFGVLGIGFGIFYHIKTNKPTNYENEK